jgi:hypothetical protein
MAGFSARIRTEHIPNTSPERYRYAKSFIIFCSFKNNGKVSSFNIVLGYELEGWGWIGKPPDRLWNPSSFL